MIGENDMIKLNLEGLHNTFIKTNLNEKYEVYYDVNTGNTLVFTPYDDRNTESIVNGIRDSAYIHLINELNTNKNLVVEWSQIEGTTSDYVIYYDVKLTSNQIKSYSSVKEELEKLVIKSIDGCEWKYSKVENGIQQMIVNI